MVIWIILCAGVLAVLCGSLYAYKVAFYSPRKGREDGPHFQGACYEPYLNTICGLFDQVAARPCEHVTILSREGMKLHGRYYHEADGAPLDIYFHGYRSFSMKDFCGGAEMSHKLGHNVLLVDQRAHGDSEGHTISFGINERYDVVSWVDYAVARFGEDTRILLYGISMGGGTVLMASELDLPKNVKGIVADCPFDSPIRILLLVAGRNGVPDWVNRPLLILGAFLFGHFNVLNGDASEAVKHTKVPILLIHGDDDNFVPLEMSRRIHAANPEQTELVIIHGADHAISYVVDPAMYEKTVIAFQQKVLNG